MNPQDRSRDEDQLASLLGAVNHDAASPDRAMLDRLREQTTTAFQAAAAEQAQQPQRRRVMFLGTWRFAAATAATVALFAGSIYWYHTKSRELTFRQVLDK